MSEEIIGHGATLPTPAQLTHLLQQSGVLTTGLVQHVTVAEQFVANFGARLSSLGDISLSGCYPLYRPVRKRS